MFKSKNRIKVNEDQYLTLEGNKVYLITRVKSCPLYNDFDESKGFTITKEEYVPKSKYELNNVLEKLTEISEKLEEKFQTISLNINETNTLVSKYNLEKINDTCTNIKEIINNEYNICKKKDRYRDLLKTDYFRRAKQIEKFKDMDDLELADLLIELNKNSSDKVRRIMQDLEIIEFMEEHKNV